MTVLYLDCPMGASGDMIVGALLELLPHPEAFIQAFNALNIHQHGLGAIQMMANVEKRCGLRGTHVTMLVQRAGCTHWECEDTHAHEHDHDHHHDHAHEHHDHHDHAHDHHHDHHDHHDHAHDHHHDHHDHAHDHDHAHHHAHEHHDHDHVHGMTMRDIAEILAHIEISAEIRSHALAIFERIAEAESRAHGCRIEQVHFHEVGQLDALADILAACMLMSELAPKRVVTSAVCVGFGTVKCAHGILPVPAPATSYLLQGVPIYAGNIGSEMCTPTGAAILKHFTDTFGSMPAMVTDKVGYGLGSRDFETAPNMLRATLGTSVSSTMPLASENLVEICTNLDDMTPEHLSFATETLLLAGALDVWTTPIVMKKGRLAHQLSCLVAASQADKFVSLMLKHTTTYGVRLFPCQRYALEREITTVDTEYGQMRQKRSTHPDYPRQKWEYEDLATLARRLGKSE